MCSDHGPLLLSRMLRTLCSISQLHLGTRQCHQSMTDESEQQIKACRLLKYQHPNTMFQDGPLQEHFYPHLLHRHFLLLRHHCCLGLSVTTIYEFKTQTAGHLIIFLLNRSPTETHCREKKLTEGATLIFSITCLTWASWCTAFCYGFYNLR